MAASCATCTASSRPSWLGSPGGQASVSSTFDTVDACHFAPPCAVGTPWSLSAVAILPNDGPAARSRLMRWTTASGNRRG